ncbi:MAG TPA: dipeptidase [Vicinamibacteria bacterium]|nr:dipeptidase [Vicinamibacteria bacterium]
MSRTRRGRRLLAAALLLVALALPAVLVGGPPLAESRLNQVRPAGPGPSARALEVHRRLLVADLHADTLLWDRDLLDRGARGHVDLPRLQAGNVALQAFTVATKTPRGLNIESNDAGAPDDLTLLAMVQGWPPRTWRSLTQRALYQARRLADAAQRSGGALTVLRSRADLAGFLERRRGDSRLVGAWLGLEGAHALEGDLGRLDALDAAGYRMIALTHFFDNEWAGSAHGRKKGGLTPAGRQLVPELERRGILLDLAHASPATIDDALALAKRPVVVSHTGVRGTCDNRRNLSDAQLRAVAATGGVVGIGFWDTAVCGPDADAIARAVVHAVRVAGVDHVGLGSDFDGAVTTPFDAAGMARVTDALLRAGLSEAQVAQVMGGNVQHLLAQALP